MPIRTEGRIAVLMGGPSAEAEVSRVSAAGVAEGLAATYSDVRRIELDARCAAALIDFAPDAVFPALHGPPGEDGTVQGMLELLGLPYVGSGVRASATAMDKVLSKHLFRAADLPVARDEVVLRGTPVDDAVETIRAGLGDDVVVKPARQGSALGVTLVDTPEQLASALRTALDFDDVVLVEERVRGRELTVGVLETVDSEDVVHRLAHPVIEIRTPEGSWYDYSHRYMAGGSIHDVPATLDAELALELQRIAVTAHEQLGCRDLSRADFVLGADGRIALLEVNTLPGMTPTSLYPDGARALGHDFASLVGLLVSNALRRGPDRLLAPARGTLGASA